MSEQSKMVALPAYLPRRLEAFKIIHGEKTTYLLRDKLLVKTHDLEPWQFFILEVLPGCEDMPKLLSVFEDRFGHPTTERDVLTFFAELADAKLLEQEAEAHPLLKPFTRQGYALEQGLVKPKSFDELVFKMSTLAPVSSKAAAEKPGASPAPAASGTIPPDKTLPAGVNEADNLDPRQSPKMWHLFSLLPFVKVVQPALAPLKWGVYVLPLLALSAILIAFQYANLIYQDLSALRSTTTLVTHAVFSLLTINLMVTLTQALVGHAFRATVGDLGIGLRFSFFPRFMVRITNTDQLSRRERMWLQGGPLLMRVLLFSVGVLVWFNARDSHLILSQAGLAMGFLCAVNIVVEGGNPLVKGNGYHLLAAFMDEPYLRGKSYKAFMDKLKGGGSTEASENLLAGYALASFIYAYFIVLIIVFIVSHFLLAEMHVGGAGIIIAVALGAYLSVRTVKRFQMISDAYERSVQFDRWRKRALPAEAGEAKQVEPTGSRTMLYLMRALPLTLFLLLFLPYSYEAGGNFDIYPTDRQVIASDIGGIVEKINFQGGESVKKGTVIARIAATDLVAQIAVDTAKITEQQSTIADLKSRPKPEEVTVSQRALDTARQRQQYVHERVPRLERLYADKNISFEELDAARKEDAVGAAEVLQHEAQLALVKVGTTPEKIAAEEAKLQALVEERSVLIGKVQRTELKMPFDGNILTLHLNDRLNAVLDKGQPFASVENTLSVTAEIQVPESEASYVRLGAAVHAKPNAFFEQSFVGKVQTIDRNITVLPLGNVVKVIAVIDNPQGLLKTGMTGYSKIDGITMPVWKAFSLALIRFFTVQVWSWLP